MAYFELAEEIADAASTPDQKELARHLFALAGALDDRRLGRSACLALADMADTPDAKRRLLALAALLDPTGASPLTISSSEKAGGRTAVAATAVCEAMSRYRKGQGPAALSALKKPGAMELLEAHAAVLPGGLPRFLDDCKQMRGSRPSLSPEDVDRMLRLEVAILTGAERSWSTELSLNVRVPALLEIDPDRLAESLGVDAGKPLFRRGRWVEK